MIFVINIIDENKLVVPIKERLCVEELAVVIIKFSSDGINEYDEVVREFVSRGSYLCAKEVGY